MAAVTSAANGSFQLAGVPASERVVVRVSAPGFVDTLAIAAVRAGSVTLARVTLLPVETSASVDPAAGVSVAATTSPAQLTAAANSFARADNGAAPSGTLTVRLTSIDPAGNADRMPGDYSTGTGATAQQIESFGALAVDIRDAQNNRYNLGTGKTATIRIPVSTRESSPPATMPLFYLDEATGRWVEQGSATLAGSGATRYYEGTVSHFSYWNIDRIYETVYVTGCVQTAAGIRTRNRTVKTEGLDYTGSARTFSDTNGDFRVAMRRNSQAVLTIEGGTESVAPTTVGPVAADMTLPSCLVERANTTILPPTIIAQPLSASVDEATLVNFRVVADGATPLRYQWRRNGANIAGATGASYMLFATTADNGAVYSVVITNANGTVTSSSATLTVNQANTAPAIVAQPVNVTVQVGQVASFGVTASGAQPLGYQWRRNGAPIAGATAATYATSPTVLGDSGATFDVVVTNNLGSATSATATLTVTNTPPAAGVYKRQLAALIAASYGAGCTGTGGATGPIVIAANGDVSWGGGSMPMSSVQARVSVSSVYNTVGVEGVNHSVSDTSINRILSISGTRGFGSNVSNAEVAQNSPRSSIVRCDPAFAGAFPVPNVGVLVGNWLQGTTANAMQCSVKIGGTTTAQSLNFSSAGGQVTIGPVTVSLNAARSVESANASDVTLPGVPADSIFGYSAAYADNSSLTLSRLLNSTQMTVIWIGANGDSYSCSGNRQP